jgi:hypothetical protein
MLICHTRVYARKPECLILLQVFNINDSLLFPYCSKLPMLKILTSGAISGFPPDTAPTSISALAFISSIGLCLGAMRVWALTGAEGSSKSGAKDSKTCYLCSASPLLQPRNKREISTQAHDNLLTHKESKEPGISTSSADGVCPEYIL